MDRSGALLMREAALGQAMGLMYHIRGVYIRYTDLGIVNVRDAGLWYAKCALRLDAGRTAMSM